MAAIDQAVAAELLSRPVSTENETLCRLVPALGRSLARDGFGDDLYDTLHEVVSDQSAPSDNGLPARLARLALPVARRRPKPRNTAAPPPADIARIVDRFGRATKQLLYVVPHRITPYPVREVQLLLDLRDERPDPAQTVVHLRRWALAIMTILDLMGDDP
ncbi:hypothetical protein [Streptomyces pinistramenti]|uniref:hypothetical protein n=1 Tax=Streptomyces pinistramenti TaxID=2884812 RepID=UPI001D09585A|nr:hypothetical protein [Streptomyces pinistramenti]MCB5911974.1 hypothetical protein [Streptomyces pinistramenti]